MLQFIQYHSKLICKVCLLRRHYILSQLIQEWYGLGWKTRCIGGCHLQCRIHKKNVLSFVADENMLWSVIFWVNKNSVRLAIRRIRIVTPQPGSTRLNRARLYNRKHTPFIIKIEWISNWNFANRAVQLNHTYRKLAHLLPHLNFDKCKLISTNEHAINTASPAELPLLSVLLNTLA